MSRVLAWTMFWSMIFGGAAMLIPGILMPAYSEYQIARQEHANARVYLDELQRRSEQVRLQIDHQKNDPAYVQRQLQLEYGITPDGIQPLIFASESVAQAEPPHAGVEYDPTEEPPIPPAAAELANEAMQRNPLTPLLLDPRTRPLIMFSGAVLILTAIFVLGRPLPKPAGIDRG